MKIVLDTNVFISGVFFSGPPYEILDAWRHGKIGFVTSSDILTEFQETCEELAHEYPHVEFAPWIDLVVTHAYVIESPPLSQPVCADRDDDKFLACALAGKVEIIVSGDKALLATSGFKGISVLTPRQFVDKHL